MAVNKNGIVVVGAVFVDIKGFPISQYIPGGRNAGNIKQVHGGVCRNIAEDIANLELRPTLISLVDDSGIGADVIYKLQRHKVNTEYMRAKTDGMGTWLAIFDNGGDVTASISKDQTSCRYAIFWTKRAMRFSLSVTASFLRWT